MSLGDELKNAKDGLAVLGEVIKAAGDNPNVKAAGSELGQTALTITKTINNALLPLAAVNFAFDKARAYFSGQFQKDMAERAAKIPPDRIVAPKASIAGPALQGLAFAHEEQNLKDLYLNLLQSAMDSKTASTAHPAFVEIIKQMSAEDASHARHFLQRDAGQSIVELRMTEIPGHGYNLVYRHLLPLIDTATGEPREMPGLPALVDNWVRLGIVEVDYDKHLNAEGAYSWVEKRPEYLRLKKNEDEKHSLTIVNGLIARTALGKLFAEAVGLT